MKIIMANSEYAKRQLEKHGWTEGSGLGKKENGRSEPVKAILKMDKAGVGHDPGKEFTDHWWLRVFNEAAEQIGKQDQDDSPLMDGTVKAKSKKTKLVESKSTLYKGFVKSSTLTNGVEEKVQTSDADSEDERDSGLKTSVPTLDDIHKFCGGATGHRAAMFGIKMKGKLTRVARYDQMFEDKLEKCKTQSDSCTEDTANNVTDKAEGQKALLITNGVDCLAVDGGEHKHKKKKKKEKEKVSDANHFPTEEVVSGHEQDVNLVVNGNSLSPACLSTEDEEQKCKKKRKEREKTSVVDDEMVNGHEETLKVEKFNTGGLSENGKQNKVKKRQNKELLSPLDEDSKNIPAASDNMDQNDKAAVNGAKCLSAESRRRKNKRKRKSDIDENPSTGLELSQEERSDAAAKPVSARSKLKNKDRVDDSIGKEILGTNSDDICSLQAVQGTRNGDLKKIKKKRDSETAINTSEETRQGSKKNKKDSVTVVETSESNKKKKKDTEAAMETSEETRQSGKKKKKDSVTVVETSEETGQSGKKKKKDSVTVVEASEETGQSGKKKNKDSVKVVETSEETGQSGKKKKDSEETRQTDKKRKTETILETSEDTRQADKIRKKGSETSMEISEEIGQSGKKKKKKSK